MRSVPQSRHRMRLTVHIQPASWLAGPARFVSSLPGHPNGLQHWLRAATVHRRQHHGCHRVAPAAGALTGALSNPPPWECFGLIVENVATSPGFLRTLHMLWPEYLRVPGYPPTLIPQTVAPLDKLHSALAIPFDPNALPLYRTLSTIRQHFPPATQPYAPLPARIPIFRPCHLVNFRLQPRA